MKEEILKKIKERFHNNMKHFTQSAKFKQSKELKLWYQESLNHYIAAFLDYQDMYTELRKIGYPDILNYPNSTEYINALKPFNDDFIEIVISWTPKLEFKSGVVQFLRESKNKYDGTILIPIFRESDKQQRWFICDAIVRNPPININEWVKDTYLSKKYGYSETGLLPLAIAKIFPKDEARAILKKGFDHHYRITPEALGKVGKKEDVSFLEKKLLLRYDATHVHRDIEKAIKRIQKREKL